jgi:hypothetical protein
MVAIPKNVVRASKRPQKSGTRKLGTRKLGKTPKLENYQNEPIGIGGMPPKSIWITQELIQCQVSHETICD